MISQKAKKLEKLIHVNSGALPVDLSTPSLSSKDINNVVKELRKNNLAIGESKKKFLDLLKKYIKSKFVLLTSNGTVSLYAALLADNTKYNDEVLVPSFNYVASVNAILSINAIPHFVDSNLNDLGVDFEKLDSYLSKNTIFKKKKCINLRTKRQIKSLVITHVFGHPCNLDHAKRLCKKYNLSLIEDASEALGSFFKKKHLGTFGKFGVLSFNGNKIITTGGGGAIITNNKKNYEKLIKIIDNGKIPHDYEFVYGSHGLNLKMPNINAAIGINQLKNIEKLVQLRRKLFKKYNNLSSKDLILIKEPKFSRSNYWLQAIKVESKKNKLKLIKYLRGKKIMVRSSWKPLHLFKHLKKFPKMKMDNAVKIYDTILNIPSNLKNN